MDSYSETSYIKSYETDHNGLFKPFSFLNHAQELANIHAQSLGFGYDKLLDSGVVWVLSRMHVKFHRLPLWKEQINKKTWHKGSDRLFGFRDFSVHDSGGNLVIAATSSWLIIDYKTRKLQRIENVLGKEFKGENRQYAIETPAERLVSPGNMQLSSSHIVSVSDLDINGHTNNAKYFEWAMDALPVETSRKMQVQEMWFNFNSESLLQEEVKIYTSNHPEIFVEGKRDGNSIFQLKIKCQETC